MKLSDARKRLAAFPAKFAELDASLSSAKAQVKKAKAGQVAAVKDREQRMSRGRISRARSGCRNLVCFCALVILGACFPGRTCGAVVQKVPMPSAGQGLPFAFADFNGDNRPDVARIHSGNRDSASTSDYWIEIRLSGSGSRLIRLVAPTGGLHVEARDVNGDHAIDLVLSTTWLSQPVAILLNDGHGRFRPVAPASFPQAFRRCGTNWTVSTARAVEPIGLLQEWRTASCAQTQRALPLDVTVRAAPVSNQLLVPASFLISGSERAPPA